MGTNLQYPVEITHESEGESKADGHREKMACANELEPSVFMFSVPPPVHSDSEV